jgi:hypothetical protein
MDNTTALAPLASPAMQGHTHTHMHTHTHTHTQYLTNV